MCRHAFTPMTSNPYRCATCGGYIIAADASSMCTAILSGDENEIVAGQNDPPEEK